MHFHLLCILVLIGSSPRQLPAQALARPGWAGSGLTVNRWWKHAVILDLPTAPAPNLQPTIDRLDNLRTLGIDAVLLRGINPVPSVPPQNPGSIDDLLREASRRNLRVLVELPTDQPPANLAAAARSWATRGAAGFLLTPTTPVALRTVRSALLAIPGERILITTAPSGSRSPAAPADRRTNAPAELQLIPLAGIYPQPDPIQMNASLVALPAGLPAPLILTEQSSAASFPAVATDLTRIAAAITLLTTPGASLLEQTWLGPPPPSASTDGSNPPAPNHPPADQRRPFTRLHPERPPSRDGPLTLLDHASEGAAVWLRRGPTGVTFVVACNLRATPLRLSLADDLARLHLRGSFLKTLSRSDPGLGAMPLNALTLPPFGVYIGELSR